MDKIVIKRNYLEINYDEDSLTELGFTDGWADFASDEENIAKYLYKLMYSIEFIFKCTMAYMEGYYVGSFMSENSPDIFDEDGCSENFDIEPNVYDFEVEMVLQKVIKGNK